MHKRDRPLIVVIERYPEGLTGTLVATQVRHMTFMEWCMYKLKNILRKETKPEKPLTGFPSVSVGVWVQASQYNHLIGKDDDSWLLPSRNIPREMILMPPANMAPLAYDEGYSV